MEYTVEIAVQTRRPLTKAVLFRVAEVGGVAGGDVGGKRLETILTVAADSMPKAAARAIATLTARAPGEVIAVEVMTLAEQDRRIGEPLPQLVGVSEIANLLKVTKPRVTQLAQRQDFPAPVAKLASGPIWRKGDLSRFADGWRRKPGREPVPTIIHEIEDALQTHQEEHGAPAAGLRLGEKQVEQLENMSKRFALARIEAWAKGEPPTYNDLPIERVKIYDHLSTIAGDSRS